MEPLFEPLTQEKKKELIQRGYKEWEIPYVPRWADPDDRQCKQRH